MIKNLRTLGAVFAALAFVVAATYPEGVINAGIMAILAGMYFGAALILKDRGGDR